MASTPANMTVVSERLWNSSIPVMLTLVPYWPKERLTLVTDAILTLTVDVMIAPVSAVKFIGSDPVNPDGRVTLMHVRFPIVLVVVLNCVGIDVANSNTHNLTAASQQTISAHKNSLIDGSSTWYNPVNNTVS